MGGIIFWIIIVIWVVIVISKNAGKNTGQSTGPKMENRRPAGTTQSRTSQSTGKSRSDQWQGYNQSGNQMKQQELKERLSKKYNKYEGNPQGDILQRAKAATEEDFSSSHADAQSRQKDMERLVAEKLAVAERLETEKYQQNHVLQTVEDLMVKGPDTNLTFERDFLAEGMDMLNRIQG